MELNEYMTSAPITKSGVSLGGASGLSSPYQLVDLAASVSITQDQTASGAELLLFTTEPITNRANRLTQIRLRNFERLGDAWRALADR